MKNTNSILDEVMRVPQNELGRIVDKHTPPNFSKRWSLYSELEKHLSQSITKAVEEERERIDLIIVRLASKYVGNPLLTQSDEREYKALALCEIRELIKSDLLKEEK